MPGQQLWVTLEPQFSTGVIQEIHEHVLFSNLHNPGEKDTNVLIDCLGYYAVSTVFQLFNGDISQVHVPWTIFNECLTSPLS